MYRAAYQTPSKRQNLRLEQQVEEYMYVRVVVNSSKRIAWTKERRYSMWETMRILTPHELGAWILRLIQMCLRAE
jgi:hypothetical protein